MGKVEKIEAVSRPERSVESLSKKELRAAAYCRVSTDLEDQKNSYDSQLLYYSRYIQSQENWQFAGVYSDEAVTGTKTDRRFGFQQMIADAEAGKIDLIICKSISRFARNTVDTLQFVRRLKTIGVEVWFEEENIRTLTMDGELLLTILSSVAQQEVENISEHVKAGMKHKMSEGIPVGFSNCLGYRYSYRKKEFVIVEEEAEIVRLIFRLYLDGWGTTMISRELQSRGYETVRGATSWNESTIIGILKNEKYVGDLLMGKTTSVDPISKKRVRNDGRSDMYMVRDNHEAIISREDFARVQREMARRAALHMTDEKGRRSRLSTVSPFSSRTRCGFCGAAVNRRSIHGGSKFKKIVWMCSDRVFSGRDSCPDSCTVHEEMIEKGFVECFNKLISDRSKVINGLMAKLEKAFENKDLEKQLKENRRQQKTLQTKNNQLIDLLMEKKINEEEYVQKHTDNLEKLSSLQDEEKSLAEMEAIKTECASRIRSFRKSLENSRPMEEFDPDVFTNLVDKVIIGGYTDGEPDPFRLTFIFKTGLSSDVDSEKYRTDKRRSRKRSPAASVPKKPVASISEDKNKNSAAYLETEPVIASKAKNEVEVLSHETDLGTSVTGIKNTEPVISSKASKEVEALSRETDLGTIVLLVISVLFLLTVPNIQKTMEIVNDKGCRAIEKVADAAILQYRMQYDDYPGSVSDLISAGLLSEDQATCDGNKTLVISGGQAYVQ